MEILKTTGVALSAHPSGEADVVCNYYTKDHGKKKFIFKGLRKSKKRSRSAVEPGAVTDIVYYSRDDRDCCIANEFHVRKFPASITGNLRKILHLYFMLEAADKTCGYNIADEGIYKLIITGMDALSKTDFPVHCSAFFMFHLMKNHGILSDLRSCKLCGKNEFLRFALDITDLRPVCGECLLLAPSLPQLKNSLLTKSTGEFIQSCLIRKFSSIDHGKYPEGDIQDLMLTVARFVENYYHTELKSKSLIIHR
ncbi:MAG: DNA repair protein RecO [Spirochaetes bacterium RBG_16_49_21]|nr:MAG: DNA repair protein RecO [Spirochaetes bacterium RBG_16_49_21]